MRRDFTKIGSEIGNNIMNYEVINLSKYGFSEYYLSSNMELISHGKLINVYSHARSKYAKMKNDDGKWMTVCINRIYKNTFARQKM